MTQYLGKLAVERPRASSTSFPARPCGVHLLGHGDSFVAHDCVCHHGARSARVTGAYARLKIAVVLGGAFHARSRQGSAVVGPGALLLGNALAEYDYRHLDDGGDRSITFEYAAPLLEELGGAGFRRVLVPPSPGSAHAVALAYHALWTGEPEVMREAALAVADTAITAERDAGRAPAGSRAPWVAQTLRHIEAHYTEDCSLATLAALAGLSSFHFLRVFRATTGQTPRQVVIALRLRAAATALRTTSTPITQLALDVGFGDLSHFTTSFTRAFGVSPRTYRMR